MKANNAFLSLREAMCVALREGGPEILTKPKILVSYLSDLGNKEQPEVRVAMQNIDEPLVASLAEAHKEQSVDALGRARAHVLDRLVLMRFLEPGLAASTADGLVGGLADYMGLPYTSTAQQQGIGEQADTQVQVTDEPDLDSGPGQEPAATPAMPVSASLEEGLVDQPPTTTPTSTPQPSQPHQPRKKSYVGLIAALVVVAAIVGVFFLLQSRSTEDDGVRTEGLEEAQEEERDVDVQNLAKGDKTYVIGTSPDFNPFEYITDDGFITGFDVELLDAIAKDQGFSYELESYGFETLIDATASGEIDGAISGISDTEARRTVVDYSDIYYEDHYEDSPMPYGFIVAKGQNAELISMFNAGLANIKKNGTYDQLLEKYGLG